MQLAIVGGCVAPASIAPYIELVCRRAGQPISSVYRGDDARALLHRLGQHTQAEIHQLYPTISNPPNHSSHELRSDAGAPLPEWREGVDSGTNDQAAKDRVSAAAAHYGWKIEHPYSRGVEGHHWNFQRQPRPNGIVSATHISAIRARQVVHARLLLHPLPRPLATRASKRCVSLIADFEGFVGHPYKDAVGVWTIGYGHTRGVTAASRPISKAEGLTLLHRDLNRIYVPAVVRALKAARFNYSQQQLDALVSFAYNLGPGLLTGDHTIAVAIRARSPKRVADAILLYDKAGSPPHALPGLTRRRQAERLLFLGRS